jgi:hypothetical protein
MASDPFELSQEETQVMLGRYAGASIPDLARSTGMEPQRVQAIVARLSRLGLLGDDADPSPPPPALEPAFEEPSPVPVEIEHHAHDDLVALLEAATLDLLPALPPHVEPEAPSVSPRRTPATRRRIEDDPPPVAPPLPIEDVVPAIDDASDEPPADRGPDEPDAAPAQDTREYRKLFEAELRPLPVDERAALAASETGARLFALCFDPAPSVIMALFTNASAGIEHARLVAFHHRDPRGLDVLAGRPAFVSDPQVHRRLLRNPGLTEPMLRKLLAHKRLVEVHRASMDRDMPDRSRVAARGLLRAKFATAQPEERVELVWGTEGRVLILLTGATFDSRTTAILCSKTYASILLVQNLARFSATPPALLAHLLRQPLVKRQPQLKNALLQHPNTPSEAKRRV